MAKLTFEDFWKLSGEDRCDQYQHLSEHDKFRVRLSMNPGGITLMCSFCKHNHVDAPSAVCDAFPGGIPSNVLDENPPHTYPYPGDHGIQFEPDMSRIENVKIARKDLLPYFQSEDLLKRGDNNDKT